MEPRLVVPTGVHPSLVDIGKLAVERSESVGDGVLTLVLDHSPIVVFVLDRTGRVLSSSGRPTRWLRRQRGPIVGRLVHEAYSDVPRVVEATSRALRGEPSVIDVTVAGRAFECAYVPVLDGCGLVERVVGVALDVTDRSRVERELRDVRDDLLEAQRALIAAESRRGTGLVRHRVLVVSPGPLLRLGLVTVLDRSGGVRITEADGADAALDGLGRTDRPDALVISAPDPVEVLERVLAVRPGVPCLIVAPAPLGAVGLPSLRAGAAGVVSRANAPADLGPAVEAVLSGRRFIPPALGAALADALGGEPTLSSRERQVVVAVARGRTRNEIATDLALSRETVATYRRRALRKLGASTDADLTRHALRERWISLEP